MKLTLRRGRHLPRSLYILLAEVLPSRYYVLLVHEERPLNLALVVEMTVHAGDWRFHVCVVHFVN